MKLYKVAFTPCGRPVVSVADGGLDRTVNRAGLARIAFFICFDALNSPGADKDAKRLYPKIEAELETMRAAGRQWSRSQDEIEALRNALGPEASAA